MLRNRLLFVCRRRESYWGEIGTELSSGLRNSVRFVVDMLNGLGIEAKMAEVVDNNCIDREASAYRPTHVILEAFWVVPEKLDELMPLHPRVRWIVRNHSEVPFLANEGIAVEWAAGYLARGVEIMCNSPRAAMEMRTVAHSFGASDLLVTHLPNYYPAPARDAAQREAPTVAGDVHIGCFGAVRPLKNHLTQAVAAMAFAHNAGLRLRFHINGSRVEGNGEPILKNLRALFAGSREHELVEHPWMPHDQFLDLLRTIDIALQVSFSETFNIVSADAVAVGVPVVASPEVMWLGDYAMASPYSCPSIADAMWDAWTAPRARRVFAQRRDLARFGAASEDAWTERFGNP